MDKDNLIKPHSGAGKNLLFLLCLYKLSSKKKGKEKSLLEVGGK